MTDPATPGAGHDAIAATGPATAAARNLPTERTRRRALARRAPLAAGLVAALLGTGAAAAQERWTVLGDVAAMSDRDERGLSLSDRGPTGVAALEAARTLGGRAGELFMGIQGGYVRDLAGRNAHVSGYAGWARRLGGAYDLSVTVYADSFHGEGSSRAYVDTRVSVARDIGLVYVRGGLSLAPDGRWSDPDGLVAYPFAEVQVPVPRLPWLTVLAGGGYSSVKGQDGGRTGRGDWFAGLAASRGPAELSLRYVDTSGAHGPRDRLGRARAVAALRLYF
ncbi:hypothetical protein CCR80_11270 [Rhodothalassium salexigens]|uniref:TorF family putative porin n=1 Tax=Rhodothalassium salexigens TaxID=1086 RepID=UPI001914628E|nr:TorF family putative porin [Rhodothalassium salexigens]MBK5921610.1 hypothetical protein [Rhodothalassium salexigens]